MKGRLRPFSKETAPTPEALERVGGRLRAKIRERQRSHALLSVLLPARSGAESRVLARLAAARARRRGPRLALGFAMAAAAAAVLLFVARYPSAEPPRPLADRLSSESAWRTELPTEHVQLRYWGNGSLGGTAAAPIIEWNAGTLEVEVEPQRGIDLRVLTADGEVRVIGTGFSVTRDARGTAVAVTHGRVDVRCADETSVLLGANDGHTCLPTRPGALLGRAEALVDGGAGPADVLDTADRGLAAGAEGPVRGELTLLRVQALDDLGRPADAQAAAEAWLATGDPTRRLEILHLAARAARAAGGCAAAQPHLEALAEGGANAPELVQLADCIGPGRPDLARTALRKALELGVPPDQEPAIVERLKRLEPMEPP